MEEKSSVTLENIQRAALDEFLDKGFLGASLRQIVKNAGVTTGAFYGYFSSKEALFASIVEPHAAALMGRFMQAQTTFAELPEPEQPQHMGLESSSCIRWMVEYICDHREPVKLLLTKAEGQAMNTLSTIWSMWRWKPHCVIWRCFGGLAIRSWSWTATCATLLPAVCLAAFLRW